MTAKSDLPKLSPEQSAYFLNLVEKSKERAMIRALNYRGAPLSMKFKKDDIERWHVAAEKVDLSLTKWIEKQLNSAAKRVYVKKQTKPSRRKRSAPNSPEHRGTVLSLKFKKEDVDTWRTAAKAACEYLTDWVEKILNKASEQK